MKVPKEFKKFCTMFLIDPDRLNDTDEAVAAAALRSMTRAEQLALKAYIDEIVGPNYGDDEIKKIWNDSAHKYYMVDGAGLRWFLRSTGDMIPLKPGA